MLIAERPSVAAEQERPRLKWAGALLACTAAVVLGPGAGAATADTLTFGSNLPAPSAGYYDSCSISCTSALLGLPGTQLVAPVSGTVTSVRLRTGAGSDPQPLRFRVLHSTDGTKYTGAGTSAPVPISTGAGITEYPVNLPVKAGDVIGFDQEPGVRANVIRVNSGAFQAAWFPALADGAAARPSDNPQGSDPTRFELLLQAELEYDTSAQFGCTDPKSLEASCADSNGVPSVCSPGGAIYPQCNRPLDLPTACSGAGTGLPTCNLPGNRIVACGGFGLNLPVCDLPPLEIPQVCGPTTVGLQPCAPANNAVLACGPTDLGFPPCAFKTFIKAPKPLGIDDDGQLRLRLGCPDEATGDEDSCEGYLDLVALARAKEAALNAQAAQLSERFQNSRTSAGETLGDVVTAGVNALNFERRVAGQIGIYFYRSLRIGRGEFFYRPLSPEERSLAISALRDRDRPHSYGGSPELYDNPFTFNAIITMVNSIDAALTELNTLERKVGNPFQRAPRSHPSAADAGPLPLAAERAGDTTKPILEKRLKLRRGKSTRVRLKLSRKVVKKLIKQAPRKARVVFARLAVSFDAEPRPIVRFVDFGIRVERKKPRR